MNEIKIKYSMDALKFLSKLDKKSVERIRESIMGLTYNPPLGDIQIKGGIFMSNIVIEAARLLDVLPEADKEFAYEFIKKLVLAWDPDFTKVTAEEAQRIADAENSGFIDSDDIDWENIGIDE